MTRWLCSMCLCCVLWALIVWNKSLHSFIHWRRASIRDVHSAEVYKRYLPNFCSDLKINNLTVEFSEFSCVGRHGWNECMEDWISNLCGFGVLPFGVLDSWCGLWPQKAPLRLPLVPLVCSKTFPVGFAQDTGKTAANAKLCQRLECIWDM